VITPTVLHAGFINEAMEAAIQSERYADLVGQANDWGLPEELRQAAIAGLTRLKLEAWASAGAKYQRALQAYEWHTMMRRPGTAIDYHEPPKPPLLLDFTYPA
jgi:hypothetical protein